MLLPVSSTAPRALPARATAPATKPAAPAPAASGDRLVLTGASSRLDETATDRLATRLADSFDRLSWQRDAADKLRLLGALAQTRTPLAADTIMRAWDEAAHLMQPMGQEALASKFRPLLEIPTMPGQRALPEAKREEVAAFLAAELDRGAKPGWLKNALLASLAVSQTEVATEALIRGYQSNPDKRLTYLTLMGACPTERLATFLAEEFDRLPAGDARRDVMLALQELLTKPLR